MPVRVAVPWPAPASTPAGRWRFALARGSRRWSAPGRRARPPRQRYRQVGGIEDDIEISWDADRVDVTVAVQDVLDRNGLIPGDSDVVVDTNGNAVTLTAHGHFRPWRSACH